jgi:Tol biopolymer transport system component
MTSELLGNAISLVKTGYKDQAREILFQIILDDPHNETAWIWLVETMPNDSDRITTLEQCLQYNPESKMAQKGLEIFRSHLAASTPATPPLQPINAPPPIAEPEIALAASINLEEKPEDKTSLQEDENQPAASIPEEEFFSSELVSANLDKTVQPETVTENEQPNPVTQLRKKKALKKSGRLWLILGLVTLILLILMGLMAYAIISGKLPAIIDTLSGNPQIPITLIQKNNFKASPPPGSGIKAATTSPTQLTSTSVPSQTLAPNFAATTANQNATQLPATPSFNGTPILPHPIYFISDSSSSEQIWRMSFDGKTLDQITKETSQITGLDVSQADGTLAYISNNQLILADAGGGNRRVLLSGQPLVPGSVTDRFSKEISNPLWSPDGTNLAYGLNGISLLNLKTNQTTSLISNVLPPGASVTPYQVFRPLAWSEDGSMLAVQLEKDTGSSVMVIQISDADALYPPDTLPCCQVSWSIDGNSLFVASPSSQYIAAGLWQFDLATGKVTNLINGLDKNTNTYTYVAWPKQSADGRLNYFYGQQSDSASFPFTLDVSSLSQIDTRSQIQSGDSFNYPEAIWAPDASLVVVDNPRDGSLELLKTDSSAVIPLAADGTNLRWGNQNAPKSSGTSVTPAPTPLPTLDTNSVKNKYIGLNYPPFPSELTLVQMLRTPSDQDNGYGISLVQTPDNTTLVWLLKYLGQNNFGGSKIGVSDVLVQPDIKGDLQWALGDCAVQGQNQPDVLVLGLKDDATSLITTLFAWRVDPNTLKFRQIYLDQLTCVFD